MASRWSNEHMVAEYKAMQANAMAVDYQGKYVLLAGRRQLGLVDLDLVDDSMKKFPRQSKWEISAVQWNPHQSHGHLFATACNQRADISSWANASCIPQGSLKAHTRVISDLDWSPEDVNLLATCSVDTFTYIWDIRDYRKPSISLQAVAGASQVKWNKVSSTLIATAHDGDIRIWDPRKGTTPVQYIAGHLSKIHGLDWCPTSEFHLASSSQDCTVKFWDVTNPRQPERKLQMASGSPVWRARYTPFGQGLITVVVPQLRRGENSLFLWCMDDLKQPVHTFVGHTDVVLEFQWRKMIEETKDYELVTWSKDQSLRIWRIEHQLQKLCGHDLDDTGNLSIELSDSKDLKDFVIVNNATSGEISNQTNAEKDAGVASASANTNATAANGTDIPIKTVHTDLENTPTPSEVGSVKKEEEIQSPHQPRTLQQEFTLVNISIPNVNVDMDAINRTFKASVMSGKHRVTLTMSFPDTYPANVPPTFQFGKPTTIDKEGQTKLSKRLRETALQHVKHNRSCIEPCLRQLVTNLDNLTMEERKSPDNDTPFNLQSQPLMAAPNFLPLFSYGSYTVTDGSVPFPRTCGARFSAAGYLVCFTRRGKESSFSRRTSSSADLTPRALSALAAFSHTETVRTPLGSQYNYYSLARSPPDTFVSLSNYYNYKDRSPHIRSQSRQRSKSRPKDSVDSSTSPSKKPAKTGPIIVYNISCLMPINRQLAEKYVLDTDDLPSMCSTNAGVAASVGRSDLVQMWSLVSLMSNKMLTPDPNPDAGAPWAMHPFGRQMFNSLMEHYSKLHDVQTLAMLCCAFGQKNSGLQYPSPSSSPAIQSPDKVMLLNQHKTVKRFKVQTVQKPQTIMENPTAPPKSPVKGPDQSQYNPYHTIHPSDTTLKDWNFTVSKLKRSNSWSDLSNEDYRFVSEARDPAEVEREQHEKNCHILDPSCWNRYDQFKKAYAELLYRWGLLNKRAELLKYVSTKDNTFEIIEFGTVCPRCGEKRQEAVCHRCNISTFQCSICHTPVRGSSSFCLQCGHGGHSTHILDWFLSHDMCPTGCGCLCMVDPDENSTDSARNS